MSFQVNFLGARQAGEKHRTAIQLRSGRRTGEITSARVHRHPGPSHARAEEVEPLPVDLVLGRVDMIVTHRLRARGRAVRPWLHGVLGWPAVVAIGWGLALLGWPEPGRCFLLAFTGKPMSLLGG